MVYDRSPIGRRVVYRLAEVATKMHDFEEAIDLYKEFVRIAPHDLNKYILKYQIYRERGSSVEDQIMILEEYKSHEYDERWAYELACLYEEAGQIDRCIEECDELILWFSEGEYVVKAMEMKLKYQELTATQQEKYEHRFDYLEKEEALEEEAEVTDALVAEVSVENPEAENEESEVSSETQAETEEAVKKEAASEEDTEPESIPQVSMISTNKYNTINLQEELAKGIQMFLTEETEKETSEVQHTQEFIPVKEAAVDVSAGAQTEETLVEGESPEAAEPEPVQEEAQEKETLSETAELHTEILKYAAVEQEPKMEDLFHTEEDGQITLSIGEENVLEKQITGQMSIGEILEAWEEKKRQAREQMENAENKKHAVPFETGEITGLLQDFIPKTPKEVQEIIEELEAEESVAESEETEVEKEAEAESEEAEDEKEPEAETEEAEE